MRSTKRILQYFNKNTSEKIKILVKRKYFNLLMSMTKKETNYFSKNLPHEQEMKENKII